MRFSKTGVVGMKFLPDWSAIRWEGRQRSRPPRRRRRAVAAAFGAMLATSSGARAEVRVAGDLRVLQVEADHASIGEALVALKSAVGLNYRSAIQLDRPLNGHFAGSLDQVIMKMLPSDYSYVYFNSAEGPKLEIVGAASGAAVAGPSEAVSAPRPLVSPRVHGRKRLDAMQALIWDETLRPGDVIVTDEGVRIFEGSWICPHAISDFRTLSETSDLSRQRRTVLAEIERAMKIKDVGRVDRPIVATDPSSPSGR